MTTPIVERARRYVLQIPGAVSGQSGHNATFRVAVVLVHAFDLSDTQALTVLREWNASCSPPWSEAELIHKIRSARTVNHRFPRGHLVGSQTPKHCGRRYKAALPTDKFGTAPKPKFCPMVLRRIAAKMAVIEDVVRSICDCSPVRVETQDSVSVLRWLYPSKSGELVLIFSDMNTQGQFLYDAEKGDAIQNCDLPAGPDGVWFLPQPVDGEFHPNPRSGGKISRRSEESVTSWRYAVLESDQANTDDWLRCLVQMPLRIGCICKSGGRSIHALVRLDATSKKDWDAKVASMKPVLITLGADAGALSAVRLTRLPQARRGDQVQQLLYLNPVPDGTAIMRLAAGMKGAG